MISNIFLVVSFIVSFFGLNPPRGFFSGIGWRCCFFLKSPSSEFLVERYFSSGVVGTGKTKSGMRGAEQDYTMIFELGLLREKKNLLFYVT